VTLTRLVLAWVAVALWFLLATLGAAQIGAGARVAPRLLRWRVGEAAVVTLFASLWFASLGSGEWWLLFLLVGILAAAPAQLAAGTGAEPLGAAALVAMCVDVARYIVAGAILAWRLR